MLTFGCELELSDIDRSIDIPNHLGYHEGPKIDGYYMGAECSIANTNGIAVDPICITTNRGGEINTRPTSTVDYQLSKILTIFDLFPVCDTTHVNHLHINVDLNRKPKLKEIKNVFRYTQLNEVDTIRKLYWNANHEKYFKEGIWSISDFGKWRLRSSGGRMIHPRVYNQIYYVNRGVDLTHIVTHYNILIQPNTTIESHTSPRSGINLVNLPTGRIEFRCFRMTVDPYELYSALRFCEYYVNEALKGEKGKRVKDIFKLHRFVFPPLRYNSDIQSKWERTKHLRDRGNEYKYYNRNADWSVSDTEIHPIAEQVKEKFK